jgi:hypothetical protein
MTPHEATRTLVKSPPEVWAQCSDADALERHLSGSFGEIRITRLEPETAVAWEGAQVRGTVRIEPSAWGTRVTLTAQVKEDLPAPLGRPAASAPEGPPEPAPEPDPETPPDSLMAPETPRDPAPAPNGRSNSQRLWARLRMRFRAVPRPPEPAGPPPVTTSVAPPPPVPEAASPPPSPAPSPEATSPPPPAEPTPARADPTEILTAALESLGQAHHRPYSRA